MAETIFINYRRSRNRAVAERLYDQIENLFGRAQIFPDVGGIPSGDHFVEELSWRVAECDVFLVVVGKDWADVRGPDGSRLIDNPNDGVRFEIEAAFRRKKIIIPILVDGAEMPVPEELPSALAPFARLQAVRLTHEHFRADIQGLVGTIDKLRAEARGGGTEQAKSAGCVA